MFEQALFFPPFSSPISKLFMETEKPGRIFNKFSRAFLPPCIQVPVRSLSDQPLKKSLNGTLESLFVLFPYSGAEP